MYDNLKGKLINYNNKKDEIIVLNKSIYFYNITYLLTVNCYLITDITYNGIYYEAGLLFNNEILFVNIDKIIRYIIE